MIQSHHIPVTRRARYHTLGDPGPGVRELWLACHGYAQLAADFLEGLLAAAAPDRLIVAPEALSRFYVEDQPGPHGPGSRVGATWMTREDRLTEIEDYVEYLDRLHEHVKGAIPAGAAHREVALGYSQGTATIARWAARTAAPLSDLVLWGGRLPPELDVAALAERRRRAASAAGRSFRVTLVVGTRDRWLTETAVRKDQVKLQELGVPARVLTFPGGHRMDDSILRTLGNV